MSEKLQHGTFIKIRGFWQELEDKQGIIVGYVDNNPIVQFDKLVSEKYPYTVLIVPAEFVYRNDVDTGQIAVLSKTEKSTYRMVQCGTSVDGKSLFRYFSDCHLRDECQKQYKNRNCIYV